MAANLEEKLQLYNSPAAMLLQSPAQTYLMPIPPEISNWRDEQRAWARSAILFDQSFHMADLYIKGPDLKKLLSHVATNNFDSFRSDRAKQLVAVNEDGRFIGDAIIFGLSDDECSIVGTPVVPNWMTYNAETGGYDVELVRDDALLMNKTGRRLTFRYQLQGPNALKVIEKAATEPLPPIKFFGIGRFTVAGHPVRALNHTMVGPPGLARTGLEIFGPAEHGPDVKQVLIEAGAEFDLREGGMLAYSSTAVESGWIALPVPAIYTGDAMKPYRQWLAEPSMESNASLGGSFLSDDITDYYWTPWDLGYGRSVSLNHDFIGRDALVRLDKEPHRTKVWLRWNDDDVTAAIAGSLFGDGLSVKYMAMPTPMYALHHHDLVLLNGEPGGVSTFVAYTTNVKGFSSVAMVDEAAATDGAAVVVLWGEPHGGLGRAGIERHRQVEIRATVSTTPLVGSVSNAK